MNNKIEQLAKEAGFMDTWYSESGDDCETELKKFAELILKEAMRNIEEQISFSDADTEYDRGVIQGMYISIHIIAAMLV